MAKEHIGTMPCPCCDEPAEIREQRNGRTYILCNSPVCGFQGFTRSAGADAGMRKKMTPKPAAAPVPPEQPTKKGFLDDLKF